MPTAMLASSPRLLFWGLRELLKHGVPDVALGFLGGIGDDLLCTAAIDEHLRRGARRIWFFTRHPTLYDYDKRVRLLPEDPRLLRLCTRIGRPPRYLSYARHDPVTDRDEMPDEHLIAVMCRLAGLTGRVRLRPRLALRESELDRARPHQGALVFQAGGLVARVPMLNKQWFDGRMQRVADRFAGRFPIIQIGAPEDPPLQGALDLRGRTSLRETAALLAQARLFVGTVGFSMHLARAVDCPAVIIYGGREPPEKTGYPCNLNIARRPACSPCWQRNRCDHDRVCMADISIDDVVTGVEQALARPRANLEVEEIDL